jgi:hypothetical protein
MGRRINPTTLSHLVTRPGIDPRVWLTLAIVEEVICDQNEGIFATVTYIPEGTTETARIGTCYTHDQAGVYWPIDEGDTVLVAIPMGDAGYGPVIISRLYSADNRPHSETSNNPSATVDAASNDASIRLQPGSSLKIRTEETGQINIKSEGSGKITIEQAGTGDITLKVASGRVCYIGDEDGAEPIPLGQTLHTFLGSLRNWLVNHVHAGVTTGMGVSGTAPGVPTLPDTRSTKGKVK